MIKILNKYKIPLLFLLFLLLHLFQLGNIPNGINVDETSLLLNAKNIAYNGTDRYNNSFPLYFKNGSSGQSAIATYIVALFFELFGVNIITLRLPFILSGCIFFFCIYLISKEIFDNKTTFLNCLLITIMPYFIMVFRWSLDCNIQILFITISLFLYIKYIKTKNKYLLILTGISFGLTLYTYILSWILIPLFLITINIIMYKEQKIKIKEILILFGIVSFIGLPLMYFSLSLFFDLPTIKLGMLTVYPSNNNRLNELSLNKPITNIATGLFNTLFFTPYLEYTSYPEFFTMYFLSIPLFIYGLLISIKRKVLIDKVMLGLLTNYLFLMAIISNPNISKLNFIFVIYLYFIVLGITNIKYKTFENAIYVVYILFFILFNCFYFNKNNDDLLYFDNGIIDTMQYVYEINDNNKDIYIDYKSNFHILIYMQYVFPIENNERDLFEQTFVSNNDFKKYHKITNEHIEENSIYILGNHKELEYYYGNEEYKKMINNLYNYFISNNYNIQKINKYYVIIT